MLNAKFWLLTFGTILSLLMYAYYENSRQTELVLARKEQLTRAEDTKKKLDEFVIVSELISRFIQEDISSKKLSQKEIEDSLKQYLRSSPSDIIFGIGIWYEKNKFKTTHKFFGPYTHRLNPTSEKIVLTYEWSTEKYDYTKQDWYQRGIQNKGESFFVDPYFDLGLVYVTNARAFYNQVHHIQGVISVDLVLPQLQNMITQANQFDNEQIFIINRNGKLLAHPQKELFLSQLTNSNKTTDQNLLGFSPEELEKVLGVEQENWVQSSITQSKLGWSVVIKSSEEFLIKRILNLKRILLILFIILWIAILITWRMLYLRDEEIRLHNEKIEQSRIQLVQTSKMAALGVMASGIAHEINNPLTIIVGKAHSIEKQLQKYQIENTEILTNIQKILITSNRITQIIRGLKTFSRSAESDPFHTEALEDIVADAILICREKFKNNEVILEVEKVPSVFINCRATQISQVFFNLLSNSFDAVENLSEKWVKVHFQVFQNEQKVCIQFVDSGKGISPAIAQQIMQPFFTTKDVGKGTGLGLSISKGIIEEHNGLIELDEKSAHTTFKIILPLHLT